VGTGGQVSYDFAWLNGPADGSYGFTVGIFNVGVGSARPQIIPRMTREELLAEAQEFIAGFYEPGGIGEEDFPNHAPAQPRGKNLP
jgi:hypothetical protein